MGIVLGFYCRNSVFFKCLLQISERQIWFPNERKSVRVHLPVIRRFSDVAICILMMFTSKLLGQLVQELICSYILSPFLKEVVPKQLV